VLQVPNSLSIFNFLSLIGPWRRTYMTLQSLSETDLRWREII
jgi:hypothetical protein